MLCDTFRSHSINTTPRVEREILANCLLFYVQDIIEHSMVMEASPMAAVDMEIEPQQKKWKENENRLFTWKPPE